MTNDSLWLTPLPTDPNRNSSNTEAMSTASYSTSNPDSIPNLRIRRSRSLAQYLQPYIYFRQPPQSPPQSSSGSLPRFSSSSSKIETAVTNARAARPWCRRCHFAVPQQQPQTPNRRLSLFVLWIICYGMLNVYIISDFHRIRHNINYYLDYLVLKLHTTSFTLPFPGMRDEIPITTIAIIKPGGDSNTTSTVPDTLLKKTTNDVTTIFTHRSAMTNRTTALHGKEQSQSSSNPVVVVAYVVVVTSCGSGDHYVPFQIVEGAAVLKHSIHQNSIRTTYSNRTSSSRYDYQLYAFYHPEARACAHVLQELGYTVQERDTPVNVKDIRGDFLRERIEKNGCCGERELIKFEAFTLTQHPIVVMVDLDVLVLKPLDRLFDFILDSRNRPRDDDLLFPEKPIPEHIDILYTTDYAMVNPGRKYKPTQGGFVVLRPNMTIYKDFVDIVTEGNFQEDGGWGGFLGKFWGAMTFQGLMPYYFQALHPGRAVELNWCVWNNMCSPSRDNGVVNDKPVGECHTQQTDCEDCRNRPVEDVALTHFTVCQKPWLCQRWEKDGIEARLCRKLHHEWFRVRSEMERSWGRSGWGTGSFDRDHFFGYCTRFGVKGYEKIAPPYGGPIQ